MKVEEALQLIRKIIVFLVESFEQTLAYMDGVKYYIAAVAIFLSARYLLGPLLGVPIMSGGSDVAANSYRNSGKGRFSPRNRSSRYGSGKHGGRYESR